MKNRVCDRFFTRLFDEATQAQTQKGIQELFENNILFLEIYTINPLLEKVNRYGFLWALRKAAIPKSLS